MPTVTRIPRTQGLPPVTAGFLVMRSRAIALNCTPAGGDWNSFVGRLGASHSGETHFASTRIAGPFDPLVDRSNQKDLVAAGRFELPT